MTETNSTWKCCYGICQCTIEDMKETRNTFYLEELKTLHKNGDIHRRL